MHYTTLLSTLAVTLLSATQAAKAYIPYAWNTSVPAIHNQAVTAYYTILDIGDQTIAFCPSWDDDCPSKNTTIITGPSDDGSMWMGSILGGQQIFTSEGGVMFTTPTTALDLLDYHTPFSVEEDAEVGGAVWKLAGGDWYFCEFDDVPFKLYAAADGGLPAAATGPCYSAKIRLEETTAPAVDQY